MGLRIAGRWASFRVAVLAVSVGGLCLGPGAVGAATSPWVLPASALASTTATHPGIDQQVGRARTRFAVNVGMSHPGGSEFLSHPARDSARPGAHRSTRTGPPSSQAPLAQAQTASGSTQPGLDVSSFQGNVDWSQTAANGATFAYVKATEAINYRSAYFAQQYNGSFSAGLVRGAYHFAVPNNSTGAAQADYFVANGGGWSADGRTLPGMLDIEYNPYGPECFGLTQPQMVDWVASFDYEYRSLTGRSPDIYTTTDWWTTCTGNSAAFAKEPLSIANYSTSPYPLPSSWGTYSFWQFADSGVFPGDQERFNGDHQALVAFATGAAAGAYIPVGPARVLDTRNGTGAVHSPVAALSSVSVQVTGVDAVPASGVSAVVLNVTVTQPTAGGYITVYPDGATRPTASNLNFNPAQTVPNLVVVPVGADGKITLYNGSAGTVQLIGDIAGYYLSGPPATAGAFGPVGPTRVLDTRVGNGAPRTAVAAGASLKVQIEGAHAIPASGISAVVLNVTVTQPTAGGYITAYTDGATRPTASNLNFNPAQTVPNLVVVPVGADGKITLYNGSAGTVQLIGDIAGYYLAGTPTTAGAFGPTGPTRGLDTPVGNGAPRAAVAAGASVKVQIEGAHAIPASGISAVVLNVTVTQPTAGGYITAYPDGATRPTASNLNFNPAQTVPNLVVVPVGADGKITLYNGSAGTVQLIGDIAGYYLGAPPP